MFQDHADNPILKSSREEDEKMTEKLFEKFSWFRDDVKLTSQVGNKIRIKGRALYATVSKNDREYIADELLRSARTLANKPIDVNHAVSRWEALAAVGETTEPKPKHVGHVLDADYEDGYIEYVAEINDNEYVAKLRDRESLSAESYLEKWGKEPIYGVSVDAVYRYPQSESEKTDITIPLGIQFIRLSLVEDPEKPGVRNTTIEIMEMSLTETTVVGNIIKDFAPDLFETYEREVVSKLSIENEKDRPKFVVSDETIVAYDPRNKYDMVRGDIPESEYTFGEEKALEVEEKPSLEERFGLTEERLGEPFADYADFGACTAANQDKDDPDAYCASIKQSAESEPVDAKEKHDKKKKKKSYEMDKLVLPTVEKVILKPLEKMNPTNQNIVIEVDSSQLDSAIEKLDKIVGVEDLSEMKPLENKNESMGLREQQNREITELQTKQFRDRNDAEHVELRSADSVLVTKLNELVETRPKDAEMLKAQMLKVVGESKTSLMNVIAELEKKNQSLAERYNDIVDVFDAQKTAIGKRETSLEGRDKIIVEKYDELVDAFETQKTEYAEENTELRESITALEAENEIFKTRNGEMGVSIDGYKSAIEALETRLGEYEEFKTANETAHTGFVERIEALEEFKLAYEETNTVLNTAIDALKEQLGRISTKVEEIEAEPKENPLEEKVEKLTETV